MPGPSDLRGLSDGQAQLSPAQTANTTASQTLDGVMPLTDAELELMEQQMLSKLYSAISSERDEWIAARNSSGLEREWAKAEALYDGREVGEEGDGSLRDVLRNGPRSTSRGKEAQRSRVRINIVAPAVDNQVARVCEILLPVDDKNWGIRPTPNPSVSQALSDHRPVQDPLGNSLGTVSQLASDVQMQALAACRAMEREIDDQLTDCQFNGESRKVIFSAAKLGTGVMKGPFVKRVEERKWMVGGGHAVMQVEEKFIPVSCAVNIRNLYPDPSCGDDIQRGKGIYECKDLTRKELRELAKRPGYDPDAIRKVLRQKPMIVDAAEGQVRKGDSIDDLYQVWEYHGEVDPEDFQLVKQRANPLADDSAQGDPLVVFAGCLIIVNDVIIAALPMMTADESLPYDFFPWKSIDGAPWGTGIPAAMETQQRVVIASWRQVMDNAGITVGPQLIMKKSAITPQNGRYEIRPNKVWFANDDLDDVRSAFTIVQIESRIEELLKLCDSAMQFANQESATSPMMAGEKQQAGETLGGMTMRWTSANGIHRMRVKMYDDRITRPHLTRYYDWNMQNSDKQEIKGDYQVDARGSSTLIERDIQNQAMSNVAAMFQNPVFAPMLKPEDALKATLKSWKLDPDEFMKTDEEIAQQNQAQAQAAQQNPQGQLDAKTQAQIQMQQLDLQNQQAEREHEEQMQGTHEENRMHEIQMQDNAQQQRMSEQHETNQVKLQMAQMAQQRQQQTAMAIQQSKERQNAMQIDSKHQLFNADAAIKMRQGTGISSI